MSLCAFISTHTPLAGRDMAVTKEVFPSRDFYSHAPRGARLKSTFWEVVNTSFLLTRPSRGATVCIAEDSISRDYFYSHAPRGARPVGAGAVFLFLDFYSHAPRGARPDAKKSFSPGQTFLLTRPSRGATEITDQPVTVTIISTHTPLAGRDSFLETFGGGFENFYSHAPRGARLMWQSVSLLPDRFLLTRPSRGATEECWNVGQDLTFLLTRPSRGATHLCRSGVCGE